MVVVVVVVVHNNSRSRYATGRNVAGFCLVSSVREMIDECDMISKGSKLSLAILDRCWAMDFCDLQRAIESYGD
jgi:hypothetical protein